jgi:phytoene dehydrogenase-like protein
MQKSVIIIGAGVAGLAAGCYAQMNGFRSEIYEMHSLPGGLCTSWRRKGYTFDGCLHWLVGSAPGSDMHRLWQEVGAVQGRSFYRYKYFTQALDERGGRITVYTDPDRLRDHLISVAPEDARLIRRITRDIKRLSRRRMPVDLSIRNLLGTLPFIYMFIKYRAPASALAGRFKNPALRQLFGRALEWHGMSAAFVLWTLSLMASGDGGYAIGGSRPLAEAMAERYRSLGGVIHFRSKVERILVESDRAAGIRCAGGSEHRSDYVISAADGHATIFDMLEGRYADKRIRDLYQRLDPFPPLVYVCLGVSADYSDEPYSVSFPLARPFIIGPHEISRLNLRIYNFDPGMAPKGKSVMTLMLETDYDYWMELGRDPRKYRAEKKRIGDRIISGIAEQYPKIRGRVEVVDVATPLTFVRYTGNWRGSYEGWLLNRKSMGAAPPRSLPGLSNFYMAGHWVSPGGGLPAGVITGRSAVRSMCRSEGRRFAAQVP